MLLSYLRLFSTAVHVHTAIETSESPRPLEGVAGGCERDSQTKTGSLAKTKLGVMYMLCNTVI